MRKARMPGVEIVSGRLDAAAPTCSRFWRAPSTCGSPIATGESATNLDLANLIEPHGVVHCQPATVWEDGRYLGNGDLAAMVVVLPVLMIAWTLFYNDLRVRKEKYDVAAMSRELGIAAT